VSKDIPGIAMTMRDEYLTKAAEFFARARCDTSHRGEFESLAKSYLRLAMQADRNSQLDVVYEPPPPTLGDKSELK
jgi:hypothetical protein